MGSIHKDKIDEWEGPTNRQYALVNMLSTLLRFNILSYQEIQKAATKSWSSNICRPGLGKRDD